MTENLDARDAVTLRFFKRKDANAAKAKVRRPALRMRRIKITIRKNRKRRSPGVYLRVMGLAQRNGKDWRSVVCSS